MSFHIKIIKGIGKQCQASVVLPGKRRKWYSYLSLIFSFSSAVCMENNSIRTSKFIHVGAFVNGKGFHARFLRSLVFDSPCSSLGYLVAVNHVVLFSGISLK